MSQRQWMQDFDALAYGTFLAAGLADTGSYVPKAGGPAQPCTLLVDRDVRDFLDDVAPVSTAYTRVTFQRGELTPEEGATVTVDGTAYTLERRISEDASKSVWVVVRA